MTPAKQTTKDNNMKKQIASLDQQLLASSVSTDSTRFHLCGIYADNDKLVATDGRRMTVMPNRMGFESGKLYDAKAFTGNLAVEIKDSGRYPNWQQFNPDLTKYTCYKSLAIPEQLAQFKSKREVENRIICYLYSAQLIVSLNRINGHDSTPSFSVNASYLRLLAGQTMDVYFKDSLSPIVFKRDDAELTYVVMPMRI